MEAFGATDRITNGWALAMQPVTNSGRPVAESAAIRCIILRWVVSTTVHVTSTFNSASERSFDS